MSNVTIIIYMPEQLTPPSPTVGAGAQKAKVEGHAIARDGCCGSTQGAAEY